MGIAGPSGAGKTSLAKKIVTVIPKSAYVTMLFPHGVSHLNLQSHCDGQLPRLFQKDHWYAYYAPCPVTNGSADENYDDYRLIDFALLVKNIKVALR